MTIEIGKNIPDVNVTTTKNESINLSEYQGKNLVLFFYPKDNTPGCTMEGQDFRDAYKEFQSLNTEILGVSRDSVKSHCNFIEKFEFPFDLISDKSEDLCNTFDVIKEKNMYGKKVMGIERSTFIIDSDGVLRHELRKIKVPGHVDNVLELVKGL